jgi:hypothetical protein
VGDKDETGYAPEYVYIDMAYPLSAIKPWPVPQSAITLHLMTWTALQSFATLDTALALPPGYQRAIEYNLAMELAGLFGAAITPYIQAEALRAKRVLGARNARTPVAGTELGSIGMASGGGFNIWAGP